MCRWPEGLAVAQLNTQRLLSASTPLLDDHILSEMLQLSGDSMLLAGPDSLRLAGCCYPGPGVLGMQQGHGQGWLQGTTPAVRPVWGGQARWPHLAALCSPEWAIAVCRPTPHTRPDLSMLPMSRAVSSTGPAA